MRTACYGLVVSVILLVAAEPFLKIFITNPETLRLAYGPLVLMALMLPLDLAGMALLNSLFGAGYTKIPAVISIVGQWVIFLPAAYLIGPVLGYGIFGVWLLQGLFRGGQALMFMWIWHLQRWAKVSI